MRDKFLIFGAPLIEQPEIDEVVDSLRSGWLGTGPKVARFEEMFRQYVGSKYAMAVNSCTAGLHLSMVAAGLGPGDEVIVPSLTFVATSNSILYTGADPVFAEISGFHDLNISPEDIEKRITPRTKAISVVHFAGYPCQMEKITQIAKQHNLAIIEDCAHGVGTYLNGKHVVFGEVTEGVAVLDLLEKIGSGNGQTSKVALITNCGAAK